MESFGNAASFSKRIVGGDAIEVIGGADKVRLMTALGCRPLMFLVAVRSGLPSMLQ